MIIKSFQILAICTSMAVTPSNFHYEQPKRANENVPYQITLTINQLADNTLNLGNNIYQYSVKLGKTRTTDVFFTKYETVNQTTYETGTGIPIANVITDNETPTQLTKFQFTPYKNLVNNNITIDNNLTIRAYTNSGTQTVKLNTDTYISQDDRWLSYLDETSYGTANRNLNIIRDIENPTNGFIYTKTSQSQNITITENETDQIIQITSNAPVNPNKTNYIFILSYLTFVQDPESMGTGGIVRHTPNKILAISPTYSNPITIKGEYINANIHYEVIDVPNVMFEVLTMPFTFISVAFNLTLFPNTPYQINISNLFLSIIGFLVFILIIKKLTGH